MRKTDRSSQSHAAGPQSRRRLFYFGPGIVIAVILAIIVAGSALRTQRERRATSGPPIVERQVISSGDEKAGPAPELTFLIERKDKLGLSDDQVERLRRLQAEWERFYVPRMKQATEAARRTNRYLSEARRNKRTPVAQIEEQAAPVISISGEISAARRRYWSRAMDLLTPNQRALAAKEREKPPRANHLADP